MSSMTQFRITKGQGYNGCIPITVYWVQVLKRGLLSEKWVNVKGFDTYSRAKELLEILQG